MEAEVWFRNPEHYIRECLETGVDKIVFDRGLLHKKSIDPMKFMEVYYQGQPWRMLVIDDDAAIELRPGSSPDSPKAVYPAWSYSDDLTVLEELIASNVAEDESACNDPMTLPKRRPRPGQEHRVVITDTPVATSGMGRRFYRVLHELQEENPEVILHVHGLYSYRVMFGLGYRAVDVEPRTLAKKGKVCLPTGQEVTFERAAEQPQWIDLLGMRPSDLHVPRNRSIFNIKSAIWAGRHFQENVRFRRKEFEHIDPDDPMRRRVPENQFIFTKRVNPQEGDKFLCDGCSLQVSCKYFRTGAVCAVPDSEPQELASLFQTRDADTILNGLGILLATNARRAARGMEREDQNDGKLDPEVTKILDSTFNGGVKLAKLLNPSLNGQGARPAFNFTQINNGPSQSIMAQVVDMLEQAGIPRADITPEMVMQVIEESQRQSIPTPQAAIDVAAIEKAS